MTKIEVLQTYMEATKNANCRTKSARKQDLAELDSLPNIDNSYLLERRQRAGHSYIPARVRIDGHFLPILWESRYIFWGTKKTGDTFVLAKKRKEKKI